MRIIEIQENKLSSLAEHVEKGLRYLGKAMQCIDELQGGGEMMGERRGYGERHYDHEENGGRYGGERDRYGEKDYRRY